MNGWMDEWMNGRIDEWMNGQIFVPGVGVKAGMGGRGCLAESGKGLVSHDAGGEAKACDRQAHRPDADQSWGKTKHIQNLPKLFLNRSKHFGTVGRFQPQLTMFKETLSCPDWKRPTVPKCLLRFRKSVGRFRMRLDFPQLWSASGRWAWQSHP